ncbi:hypothetical protein KP509_39G030700 [Ceratopteris richardii]|nr:hypothetical protein KP509_39G030700 [Ceratopteris richardii]
MFARLRSVPSLTQISRKQINGWLARAKRRGLSARVHINIRRTGKVSKNCTRRTGEVSQKCSPQYLIISASLDFARFTLKPEACDKMSRWWMHHASVIYKFSFNNHVLARLRSVPSLTQISRKQISGCL